MKIKLQKYFKFVIDFLACCVFAFAYVLLLIYINGLFN